ncbi:hypothetical protein PAMC26577_10215 [Caballeronia sordidicola]|uniref:Uncharacterized protein n=1 Tax=Caballeronia sordidicola TaxID=196367 RepID=A0A242MYX2_CABSO|nr:hypothetical protein PAMC26577_10215 [Caballeronia sordidicola]
MQRGSFESLDDKSQRIRVHTHLRLIDNHRHAYMTHCDAGKTGWFRSENQPRDEAGYRGAVTTTYCTCVP